MLQLLALTCLLLLAMLRSLDGFASGRFDSAASTGANVALKAVNKGCGAIFVADFKVRSDDAASDLQGRTTAIRGSRSESRMLILSTLNAIREKPKSGHGRIGGNDGVPLPSRLVLN